MAKELARIVTFNFVDMDFWSSEKRQALPLKLPHIIDGLMPGSGATIPEEAIGGTCPERFHG
jgi:hypothetical protein